MHPQSGNQSSDRIGGSSEAGGTPWLEAPGDFGGMTGPAELRILQLECEVHRLQRLVAELLIKNQQLRKTCSEAR